MTISSADGPSHLRVVPDPSDPVESSWDRRPRRDDALLLTLRVTLDDIDPVVWREVKIRSNIFLPELHEVLQDIMGWEERHLHFFYVGDDPYGGAARFDMQFTLEEDGEGMGELEDDVRVDEILAMVGDELRYEYDFGDGWGHLILVQSVEPATDNESPVCIDGERACPPEDCGGPWGYKELLGVLKDPNNDEYEHLREWSNDFDPERFAVAGANASIAERLGRVARSSRVAEASPKLVQLFDRVPLEYHVQLSDMIDRIEFSSDAVDPTVAGVAMEKLTWLLKRLGSDGIALTGAGYLPPKHIVAMRDELDWDRAWIGNSTREADNRPVQILRDSALHLGLVRKYKGRLVSTKLGKKYVGDPVGLWREAANTLPIGKEDFERDGGVLLLAAVAAGANSNERNSMMVESMDMLGWRGPSISRSSVQYAARPTLEFLRIIGALGPWRLGDEPAGPEWGREFAAQSLSSCQSV